MKASHYSRVFSPSVILREQQLTAYSKEGGQMVRAIQDRQLRPEIAFSIFTITSRFHLSKNGRKNLKMVSKVALKKWNTNSVPFEAFLWQIYQ